MKNHFYNMFTAIKNGQLAKRNFILINSKKVFEPFLKILWNNGFIVGYKKIKITNNIVQLKIFLKYKKGKPVINSIKFISKPSRKLYYSINQIWKISSNDSLIIFSTNEGLKSGTGCKKRKIGGEPVVLIN